MFDHVLQAGLATPGLSFAAALLLAVVRVDARGDGRAHALDELGELATAFNSMAENLQSTTVSRAYLEGVVNSMTEALFVISAEGIVQTANPAARRLLGYEEAELLGKPLHRLSSAPEQILTAFDPAPWRATIRIYLEAGPLAIDDAVPP